MHLKKHPETEDRDPDEDNATRKKGSSAEVELR